MRTKLTKARTGYYEIRWTEGGRSKTVSTRTKDPLEAKAFRASWVNALKLAPAVSRLTVEEICREYLRVHCAARGRMEGQMWSLKAIRGFFGPLSPGEIHAGTVEDYRAHRKGVKDGTVRRELGALVAALNWGARQKMFPREDVPVVSKPADGAARSRFLAETEEKMVHALALEDSVKKARLTRLTRFMALAMDTAARKEAIEGLTWDRVDLVRGTVDYRDPGVRVSRKKRVVVPISGRLLPVLKRARQEATGAYVLDHAGDIQSAFDTWKARHGLDFNIHDLRRTWATLALRARVSPWEVAGVLGDSVTTVMKNYAVHTTGHLQSAVDARFGRKGETNE